MRFLIQFKRFRRGVPEVIGTVPITAVDGAAALAFARSLAEMRHWPTWTDALRVMDDGGRTLFDWTLPAATAQPVTYKHARRPGTPGSPGMGLISLHGKALRVSGWEGLTMVGEFDPTYLHLVRREAL
ncbi:hypothetical protein [Microvirga aerophila]|nr:hypothetical protein [Microvirga aerophila]